MDDTFKEKIVDEFVDLHLRLHYPKVSGGYESSLDATYERLQDEIKIEYLKKILRLNPDWDLKEMSLEASKKIRGRVSLY